MGILDTLRKPETIGFLGHALQQIGATGNPKMQTFLQDRFMQERERKRMQQQLGGLLNDPNLTEQQRGILGILPPEQGMGILAQQAFAQDRQIPGRDVPFSPEVLEQQLQLRGQTGEAGGPDIGPVTPRDYTPESIAKFSQSGNYNDLQRYERPRTSKVDTETETLVLDNDTGQVLARYPKQIEEAAAARSEGTKVGEARASLPTAAESAARALNVVKQLRNHPGRYHGLSTYVPPRRGTKQFGFDTLLTQAKGQLFLEAYQSLKGGGHITEIEGTKAEQALARLDKGLSREEFDTALNELETVIQSGFKRARQRAKVGGRSPNVPRETIPNEGGIQPGAIEDGYRFKGGDPSDPNSWERVQ